MEDRQKLRLKLPGGAEFEAEGTPDFVRSERQEFLAGLRPTEVAGAVPAVRITAAATSPEQRFTIPWEAIIEHKGQNIHLRAKLPGDRPLKDACLVLLAASHRLLHQPKPTAAQLAKWLRISGYPVQRMDRSLQEGIAQGELLASGSRRARRYELTSPGRVKAFLLAHQLATAISGAA